MNSAITSPHAVYLKDGKHYPGKWVATVNGRMEAQQEVRKLVTLSDGSPALKTTRNDYLIRKVLF